MVKFIGCETVQHRQESSGKFEIRRSPTGDQSEDQVGHEHRDVFIQKKGEEPRGCH
jgi:hypothetical protein